MKAFGKCIFSDSTRECTVDRGMILIDKMHETHTLGPILLVTLQEPSHDLPSGLPIADDPARPRQDEDQNSMRTRVQKITHYSGYKVEKILELIETWDKYTHLRMQGFRLRREDGSFSNQRDCARYGITPYDTIVSVR